MLLDKNRVVAGVEYAGLEPTYGMFDASVAADLDALRSMVPGAAVGLECWSTYLLKLLVYVDGTGFCGRFFSYVRTEQ